MKYASLCILSYERPQFIFETIASARDHAGYPCEVIVHDDGTRDPDLQHDLLKMLERGEISRLVLSPPGHNEGVGASFNRAAALATGDPIIKLDQDLLYTDGWLARVVNLLRMDDKIGALGLFKYYVDPVDWRKMTLECGVFSDEVEPYHYVRDFVGSAVAIPRRVWDMYGPWAEHSSAFAEDVQFKVMLQDYGLELALPDEDLAHNRGFGIGPSTVVVAHGTVREIHEGPVIFGC